MWILRGVGYFAPDWVTHEDPSISCSAYEMIEATNGVIITNWEFIPAAQEKSITGRVRSLFVVADIEVDMIVLVVMLLRILHSC